MDQVNKEIDKLLSRHLFWEFCLFYDKDFFARRPFMQPVAEKMQWLYNEYTEGRARKIALSMPPRAGKSYITSLFAVWWLGKLPQHGIMRNACTSRLYQKFSYDTRAILRTKNYQSVFPHVILSKDKQNIDGWNLETSKQVAYFGAGVGGTVIGFGANLAISDDLYRGIEDALSLPYNEKVHRWKESTHDSRKEKNCPELFIGTRWGKKDVIGKAIDDDVVDATFSVPALTPEGFSFCEDVKGTGEYLEMKDRMDESIWEAEFMQNPMEIKGTLFPKSELNFYDPKTFDFETDTWKSKIEFAYMQMDAADDGGDFYAAPACVLLENGIYIPDVIFNTSGVEITEPDTVSLARKWKINAAQFEGNGGWVSMGKSIRRSVEDHLPDCEYRIIKNHVNKETRILAQSGFIKRNFYFRSDWETCSKDYRAFVLNLISYLREGGNKHDDAADVAAGVAKYFSSAFPHLF